MALNPSKLYQELLVMDPAATESAGISNWTNAYSNYATSAQVIGPGPATTNITQAGINLGKTAMASALIGVNTTQDGLARLPIAAQAFWTAIAVAGPVSFPVAVAVTPPPQTTLAARWAVLAAQNVSNKATKEEAIQRIANLFHSEVTNTPGTASFPMPIGPVGSPIF